MKITNDVIADLLPAYLAGEASEDTRVLVEMYIRENSEFAELVAPIEDQLSVLRKNKVETNQEKEILIKVKRILRWRSILFGVALFFSMMPLAMAGNSEDGVTWSMFRDAPAMAGLFSVSAVVLWGAYYWTHRTLADR